MRVLGSEPHLFGLRPSGHVLQAGSWPQVSGASPLDPYFLLVACWHLVPEPQAFPVQDAVGRGCGLRRGAGGVTLPYPLLASLVESPSLVPQSPGPRPPKVLRPSPLWPVRSQQPPSPLVSEEPRSCLGQAGPPTTGADKALMPDSRWVPGRVCTSCQGLLPAPQPPSPGPSCPDPLPRRSVPIPSSLSARVARLCRVAL